MLDLLDVGADRRVPGDCLATAMAASRDLSSVPAWAKRLRSVMSRVTFAAPVTAPLASLTGETATETSMTDPSLRMRLVSKRLIRSPRRTRSRIGVSSPARSGGISTEIFRPMISSAV